MSLSALRRLIIPILLLLTAILLLDVVAELRSDYLQFFSWLPYVTLCAVFVLCLYYNQARLFTAALALLVSYYLIRTELQVALTVPHAVLIYSMLSIALPVTLLLLMLLPARGLRNLYGALLAAIVPLQLAVGLWLIYYFSATTTALFINTYMPVKPVSGYVLSITGSACFCIAFLAGVVLLIKRNSEDMAALLAVLLFCFVTLAFFKQMGISTIMFSAAGISLIISLLRNSYDMVYRDDLTGLLGRRALNERLKGLAGNYVIAMMDVDHFKKINDIYGHDIGDEVLNMVGKHIAAVQGGGTAYRYGGEEFCIVFAGKNIQQCKPLLEEIRLKLSNYNMALRDNKQRQLPKIKAEQRGGRRASNRDGKTVSVTISIGVAEQDKLHNRSEYVLKAADSALYKAKKNGRNCLVCY